MRIDLEDGKYTYVLNDDEPGSQYALRHGAPWRDLTGDKFVYCMAAKIEEQAERIKELESEVQSYELIVRAEDIRIKKQSAALKLASLALSEGVEYVEEPPEKNCTCHLSPPCNDCVDHSAVREFFVDARKALAAIDALKGE